MWKTKKHYGFFFFFSEMSNKFINDQTSIMLSGGVAKCMFDVKYDKSCN